MEDATAPKHSTELINWDEYVAEYQERADGDVPEWKIRRLAISMSHNDDFETKILDA